MHLRKMSRQNEASIARHRALVERLSNINPDVRDARNRLLPDIETRRAAFRGDVEFRARLAEERFTRIEASLADAVPFRDFGTPSSTRTKTRRPPPPPPRRRRTDTRCTGRGVSDIAR